MLQIQPTKSVLSISRKVKVVVSLFDIVPLGSYTFNVILYSMA